MKPLFFFCRFRFRYRLVCHRLCLITARIDKFPLNGVCFPYGITDIFYVIFQQRLRSLLRVAQENPITCR